MNALQLYTKLGKLIQKGYGASQVDIQRVVNGTTFAEEVVECEKAKKYDGDMIWLYVAEIRSPEWMI